MLNVKRRTPNVEHRTPLLLIEEAIQLLRASPATVYALYSAGTIPFLLAFFNFCAEMSYDRDAHNNCAASALAMAMTYGWMKGLQAFCCRELVRVYTGQAVRWWKPATMFAIWLRQIAFQPFGFFVKPLAWLLIFPLTYVCAFFQNLTILGGTERDDIRKSWQLARLWPKQSYTVSGLLSLLALVVFFDLYAIIFSVPFLFKILLGTESFLTRSYSWAYSPVLLIAVAAITYFVIDFLAKAIEVIRCCDAECLATGADLLRTLAALQNPPVTFRNSERISHQGHRNVCLLCCAFLIAAPLGAAAYTDLLSAAQSQAPDQRLTQPAFDRQIERVLHNPEYNWREGTTSNRTSAYSKKTSIIDQWRKSLRQLIFSLGSWVRDLVKSLLKPFDLKPPIPRSEVPRFSALLNALGYFLWAAFAATLIFFAIRLLKFKATKLPPSIASPQKPDLAAEEVEANQLPDDEWYALAREKMAEGEFSQAQRAFFLAILSYLASRRFITVERWKTNTDYEKELGRKVKHLSELPALFSLSRLGFERCWYGEERVTPADLEKYNLVYERIKHAAV
jgi:hypothetical protein